MFAARGCAPSAGLEPVTRDCGPPVVTKAVGSTPSQHRLGRRVEILSAMAPTSQHQAHFAETTAVMEAAVSDGMAAETASCVTVLTCAPMLSAMGAAATNGMVADISSCTASCTSTCTDLSNLEQVQSAMEATSSSD
jgi:hypothetical protein